MGIFQHFGHFFIAAGLLFSSFLGNHHAAISSQSAQPTVTAQNTSSGAFYNATRSFSYQGYNVTVSMAVPKNGGNITGTISGDCNGTITGHYDGQNNGAVNGQVNGSCGLLFVQIPGSATFTGTVNQIDKTSQLLVTVNVSSFQKTEPVTLSFN